jgi:hypothetical protein
MEKMKKLIIFEEENKSLRKFLLNQIKNYSSGKDETEIKLELIHFLYTHEWCGECPAPLGLEYHKRLLMQNYIPNEFKEVCEDYLVDKWSELNDIQKNILIDWINF